MKFVPNDYLLDYMVEIKRAGIPFVVATVIGTDGATPRKAGAKMVVTRDGPVAGTVGGGAVEERVVERCKALLASEPIMERFTWDLSSDEAGGMICGGRMEFLLEPYGVRPKAFVFGAGHVGLALARLLSTLRFDITVIDDRAELLSDERLKDARTVCGLPSSVAATLEIPVTSFCVIATRSHKDDFECLKALVRRDLKYLGLLSSRKKRNELFSRLITEGISRESLERVRCPIGLAIGAETPEEIAVSIAAEMLAVLRGARFQSGWSLEDEG